MQWSYKRKNQKSISISSSSQVLVSLEYNVIVLFEIQKKINSKILSIAKGNKGKITIYQVMQYVIVENQDLLKKKKQVDY